MGWRTIAAPPIAAPPIGTLPAGGRLSGSAGQLQAGVQTVPRHPGSNTALTLMELFRAWAEHHLRAGGAPTTPPYWRLLVAASPPSSETSPPGAVTSQQVRDYRDHLLASGRKLRTARHADFAALRALFHFAVENGHVATNPVTGVKFVSTGWRRVAECWPSMPTKPARSSPRPTERPSGLPLDPLADGAHRQPRGHHRQPAGVDVQSIEGIWCLKISRDAGPIKTAASERLVPIHSAILQRGFLAFVRIAA